MIRTKVVKFPIDVLKDLERDFPYETNPARIRKMHEEYVEMKQLKTKINKAGVVIYGKTIWNNTFNKK